MELQHEWWKSSLAEEIHICLCDSESKLPAYYGRSPQLSSRRILVDWLAYVCDTYNICASGQHLAVKLLDYFMDRFSIEQDKLKLVALGCLLIAAKFEEQEVKIPKASELNKFVGHPGYSMATYLKIELLILETFDWKISFPTAAHFADYFMRGSVAAGDYHRSQIVTDLPKTTVYVYKYLNYFMEISLQEPVYHDYKPSLVCAACIASSRMCLQICPPWSITLQKLTKYTWKDLQQIVHIMLRTHAEDDKKAKQNSPCNFLISQISPASSMSAGSLSPPPSPHVSVTTVAPYPLNNAPLSTSYNMCPVGWTMMCV